MSEEKAAYNANDASGGDVLSMDEIECRRQAVQNLVDAIENLFAPLADQMCRMVGTIYDWMEQVRQE
ncbi:MAG TPA: hypothetical protein VLH56_01985, partial [Dissulfurispiraceae bacterium]|nr:hypothetical protein [Dissulfurispiraceae bacterium]